MTDRPVLLALLPGADMSAADFETHGLIAAARRRCPSLEIAAFDSGTDCYLDETVAGLLQTEIIAPARSRGIGRIWIAGISLGGMGALLHAQAYPGFVEGLLLLSPFIGSRGLIDKVAAAGGIARWQTPAAKLTPEQGVIAWIRDCHAGFGQWPEIRLAYGTEDRFAAAHRLLAEILPADKVVSAPGGHDWRTWSLLWDRLLDGEPFTLPTLAETRG